MNAPSSVVATMPHGKDMKGSTQSLADAHSPCLRQDGQTSVLFQNGDLKEIRPDGVVVSSPQDSAITDS